MDHNGLQIEGPCRPCTCVAKTARCSSTYFIFKHYIDCLKGLPWVLHSTSHGHTLIRLYWILRIVITSLSTVHLPKIRWKHICDIEVAKQGRPPPSRDQQVRLDLLYNGVGRQGMDSKFSGLLSKSKCYTNLHRKYGQEIHAHLHCTQHALISALSNRVDKLYSNRTRRDQETRWLNSMLQDNHCPS